MTNCKTYTINLKLLSVNCVFVVFLVSKQTAVLIIIFSASKQTASHPLDKILTLGRISKLFLLSLNRIFRGDGRGVKIHMKKGLLHVSHHITNLFLETKKHEKAMKMLLLTLFCLCFIKLNNRKQADMSVLTSTPSISK